MESKCGLCGGESLFIGGNWCCQNEHCRDIDGIPEEDMLNVWVDEVNYLAALPGKDKTKKIKKFLCNVYNLGYLDGYHIAQDEEMK